MRAVLSFYHGIKIRLDGKGHYLLSHFAGATVCIFTSSLSLRKLRALWEMFKIPELQKGGKASFYSSASKRDFSKANTAGPTQLDSAARIENSVLTLPVRWETLSFS